LKYARYNQFAGKFEGYDLLILSREVAATLSVDYQFTPINEQCQDLLASVLTSGDKKFAVMQHPINSTLAIIYRFV
jgi:hypothetical protein